MKKLVSERIRLLRLSNNLSQENMADELGISVGAYSNIERGVTDITITRLNQLAEIFQINPTDLLTSNSQSHLINDPVNTYGQTMEMEQISKELEDLKEQVDRIMKRLNM